MRPTILQYDAEGWGVGEVWLDEQGRVFYSELPRPRRSRAGSDPAHVLTELLQAFFAGDAVFASSLGFMVWVVVTATYLLKR